MDNNSVKINAEAFRDAISKSGKTAQDISVIIGLNRNYISNCCGRGIIDSDALNRICMLIGKDAKDFKPAQEVDDTKKSSDNNAPYADSLNTIADGFVSLCRMVETMQKNVDNLARDMAAMKDEQYSYIQNTKAYRTDIKKSMAKIIDELKYKFK